MAPTPQRPLPKPVSPEEQPIINSPFYLPEYHWPLNSATKAFAPAVDGRRMAQNMPPVAGSRGKRRGTPQPGNIGVNWEELKLVNQVRQGVSAWRQSGYPDTTSTTRELINHWTDREEFPLYFAQIDAVLIHIYLRETSPTDITQELERINLKRNDGIDRIAHKMATATGKTPVMAMLILWQAANQYASGQENPKFVRRFLLLTPGLTVRERLQDSLDPRNPNNDWKTFNLIPPGDLWEPALASAGVKIANYHQLDPRTLGLRPSDKGQLVIDGGSRPTTPEELDSRVETPAEVVERIADGKTQRGNILVINDEGHHCHRGDPDRPNQSDTQWFTGIRQSGRRGPRGPRPPTPPDVLSVSGGFLYCFNRCYHPSRLVSVQTPWSLAAPRSPQFRFRLHQGRRGARSPSSIQEGRVVRPCLAAALRPSSPLDWLLAVEDSALHPDPSRLLWPRLTSPGPSPTVAGAVVPIPSGQPQRSPRVSYASFPRSPPDLPTHMSG